MTCCELPADGFELDKNTFFKDLKKNYNEGSDIGSFLKVDIEYHKQLHKLHNNLLFLSETMIGNKCEKLVCNL